LHLNSCHLDKQKVSRKINCFFFLPCLKAAPMTFPGCFDVALSKWKCALAALASWSSPFPLKKNYSPCHHSAMKPQSLEKVVERSGWGGSEWRQLTFPSAQPSRISLGQILGCVWCGCCWPRADGVWKDPEGLGDADIFWAFWNSQPVFMSMCLCRAAKVRSPILSACKALSSAWCNKWQRFFWLRLSNMRSLLTSVQLGLELISIRHRC